MSYLAELILENDVLDLKPLRCWWRNDLLNDLIESVIMDETVLDIVYPQIKYRKAVIRETLSFVHSLIILLVLVHLLQKYVTIELLRNTIQDLVDIIVNV